jgi:hypothetical protein
MRYNPKKRTFDFGNSSSCLLCSRAPRATPLPVQCRYRRHDDGQPRRLSTPERSRRFQPFTASAMKHSAVPGGPVAKAAASSGERKTQRRDRADRLLTVAVSSGQREQGRKENAATMNMRDMEHQRRDQKGTRKSSTRPKGTGTDRKRSDNDHERHGTTKKGPERDKNALKHCDGRKGKPVRESSSETCWRHQKGGTKKGQHSLQPREPRKLDCRRQNVSREEAGTDSHLRTHSECEM